MFKCIMKLRKTSLAAIAQDWDQNFGTDLGRTGRIESLSSATTFPPGILQASISRYSAKTYSRSYDDFD